MSAQSQGGFPPLLSTGGHCDIASDGCTDFGFAVCRLDLPVARGKRGKRIKMEGIT